MSLFTYIRVARKISREIKIQKRFNKSFLIPYLNELETKYNGRFKPEQREKILNYYGLFITSFLCSSYKRLSGKVLSDEERKRATLFGVLTPVGDDLFDIDHLDINSIRTIAFAPDNYEAISFTSSVAKEIQTFQLKHVPHREEYLEAAKNVLEIQIETIKQTNRDIPVGELERITYTKGAVSVIIYHQALDDVASEQMHEVLFLIGSLYQLGNDVFDLYKDVRDNIYTLFNTCEDYALFKKTFLDRVRLQNSKIMNLPYPYKSKREFCILMNTINARSLVAIDQFRRFQKKKGIKIDWWQLERKDMICDMEKPVNIIRWLYFIFKLPNLMPSLAKSGSKR